MEKRKDRAARRIADVLRPGETIHGHALCHEGTSVVPGKDQTQLVVAITDDRLLIFRATWLGYNSGKLLHEIALDEVRHVESKTGHTVGFIRNVRTRVVCANDQVLDIVSSGFTFRNARSLGEVLTSRTEARPRDSGETPPGSGPDC